MSDQNNKRESYPPFTPVTIQAGQIQFIEACLPPLVAGDYRVRMTQVIKETKDSAIPWNSDPYADALDFRVDAPRFTLNPAEIHSVYPPSGQSGKFDNSLAHIVFTRRTLPWERTLDGTAPTSEKCNRTWMALLLLEENELLPAHPGGQTGGHSLEPRTMPILHRSRDSLLRPSGRAILAPDLGQNGSKKPLWEKEQARYEKECCLAFDLPADLFKVVAPRYDDLPYLAHVRQIDTGNKEVLAINDKGWFSLVLGNRIPQANKHYRAFLVSLEGHQAYLQEDWKPEAGQWVRLALLGTWRFTCSGSNDFKTRMDLLNFDPEHPPANNSRDHLPDSWLRLPCQDPVIDNSLKPRDIVNSAFARGYTAFNHVMRQGEQTVSWFRGPLAPLNYQKPPQVEEPVACADQLLRYDPDKGLFDVTFASAWQLGRLLALQNKSFALGLNRARQSLRARSEEAMRQAELKSRRQALNMPDEDSMENSLLNKLISSRNTLFSDVNSAPSGTTPRNGDTNDKAKPFKDYAKDIIQQSLDELLADVSSWLGRLVLLYGVPFNYLIPDEKMLPRESIRFFFLDPVWIQYLIQGACSVGNNGYGDSLIDQAMNQWVQHDSSWDKTPRGRVAATAAGVRDRLRQQLEGGPPPEDSRLDWPLTGFLLRSGVVAGWRGLEITGYGQNNVSLKPLRIEQLTSDVMLAIFNGVINKVTIRQPQEGLHFGLRREGSSYIKKLRDLGNVDPAKVGKPLKDCEINLAALDLLRNNDDIVDIAALARTMAEKLSGLGQLRDGRFTSAEFAVEMIEAAGEFNFITQGKP